MGARGRLWPWLLVLALVAAQALGLMHRVVHGPQVAARDASATAAADRSLDGGRGHGRAQDQVHAPLDDHVDRHGHAHGHGGLAQLFAGHADDSSCRLFDPLSHEGMPSVAMVVLPLALSSFFLDLLRGGFVARWSALFDARGPPPLR